MTAGADNITILEIFVSGSGWVQKEFTIEKSYCITHPNWDTRRVYEIWKDNSANQYWALLNQEIASSITDSIDAVEPILNYSQQNNWVVETFRLASDYSVTKYYGGYYPVMINEASTSFYDYNEYQSREFLHHYLFGNSHKEYYFHGVDVCADELPVSKKAQENRMQFYIEAVKQHEAFSDATGCYFSDINPNNFLANRDYSDIKIIDVGSISVGHIKNYVCHNSKKRWPLPNTRIVGPPLGDKFYKVKYHENEI